ncbi:uncharacterized protein K489DRAFT_376137 [Dissoconium aciculare CBS 342.82]|uniref:Uncharacterized protein n=1 Tax=Dissoconium aciculare CBS 342.82 TaxID=1314786 RepID=A0A6J3MD00_9PEZI|nr:uncharacterized protein K489DRAFT_376137 [Dissoconium aciculare CBS 342.82]KAF1825753.1 hypothetical protein K489DRAFT_376137 [Dissoconium aciculare CBS 342.82]
MALLMAQGHIRTMPNEFNQHAGHSYIELNDALQSERQALPYPTKTGRSTVTSKSFSTLPMTVREFRSASTIDLKPRMNPQSARPSTAAPRRMTESIFRPSTGVAQSHESPYASTGFPAPRSARQRAASKADSTFSNIKEKVYGGFKQQKRQPVYRPWEEEKPAPHFFPGCIQHGGPEADHEPVRLMMQRRPQTTETRAPREVKLCLTTKVHEVSPLHEISPPPNEHRKVPASKRISVTVHGLGQKVKNRMSSFGWKKEPRAQEIVEVSEEQPRKSISVPKEFTPLPSYEGRRPSLQVGGNTVAHVPRGRELSRKSSLTTSAVLVPRAHTNEDALQQEVEPLIASSHHKAAVHSGSSQATERQRPATTASAGYFSHASRTGSSHHSRAMSRHSSVDDDEQHLDDADARALPSLILTRIQTAIQEADENGAFKEEVISARFDSAYGSSTNLDDQFDAAGNWQKGPTTVGTTNMTTAGLTASSSMRPSPSQPSTPTHQGRSSRPRVRKAASESVVSMSHTAASHSSSAAASRSRPPMPKRSSVWSFSRPQSGTSTPVVKRDMNIAAVATVAGKSIQRSSMMVLSGMAF